jgi:hypothetical protein
MGDEAFFLLGDDCFLGNLVALVVAMFAIPIMMVRRAEVAKMGMMMMSKEKL